MGGRRRRPYPARYRLTEPVAWTGYCPGDHAEKFIEAARHHLPTDLVDQVTGLVRPAIWLTHAPAGATDLVGHLGGDPMLPPDMPWPQDDDLPLTHVMTLDLAVLPRIDLDLPKSGRLLFFYYDPESSLGQVHHIPSDVECHVRAAPSGADEYTLNRVDLTAVVAPTAPEPGHPYLAEAVARQYDPDSSDEDEADEDIEYFEDAIGRDRLPRAFHLIGGYGVDVQHSADFAPTSTPVPVPGERGPAPETELPIMLAQIDTDSRARIGFGDMGISHWSIDRADLAARRFDRVRMAWNCF